MTDDKTHPDGQPITVLEDILRRHGPDSSEAQPNPHKQEPQVSGIDQDPRQDKEERLTMGMSKAIVFGLALIALAISTQNMVQLAFQDILQPADAEGIGDGQYIGAAADAQWIWVVNTKTGAVRKCNLSECGKWIE